MKFTNDQIKKIKDTYFFVSEFKRTLEMWRKKQIVVGNSVVREYEKTIEIFNREIPGVLDEFNASSYIPLGSIFKGLLNQEMSFGIDGLLIRAIKDIAALKTKLDFEETSPIVPTKDFSSVSDSNLRKIIERDYIGLNKCLAVKVWKAVIILAGGLIEALLLDSLLKDENKARSSSKATSLKSNLKKWDLGALLDVAVNIELINPGAEKLSDTVRKYRNLVHPGNELRSSLKIEPEEAKIAVEVLNMIIRDLQDKK